MTFFKACGFKVQEYTKKKKKKKGRKKTKKTKQNKKQYT